MPLLEFTVALDEGNQIRSPLLAKGHVKYVLKYFGNMQTKTHVESLSSLIDTILKKALPLRSKPALHNRQSAKQITH